MKSRMVGTVTGNLDAAAQLIRLKISFATNTEFLVWVEGEGIYMSPVSTRESQKVAREHPHQVVNSYVLTRRTPKGDLIHSLKVKDVLEDLQFHLGEPA